ncbi:MAG: prepilin peptidase [Spirochaetaceae bacterium]|jgi:prepilin signal peptidase PulO-like enzyme (type II secretory pathway)|nr:prepilin peptidase [Spirochaetaceae bacterium]
MTKILPLAIFIVVSCIATLQDICSGKVLRVMLLGCIVAILILQIFIGKKVFIDSIMGALFGIGLFLLVWLLTHHKLGLADVWYAGCMGAVLGLFWLFPAIIFACFCGILYCVIKKSRTIRFIPFMATGAIATMAVRIIYA